MSKFGIVTFFRDNYGAFLQAYALENTLMKLGHDVEILDYDYTYENCLLGVPIRSVRDDPRLFTKKVLIELLRYGPHKEKKRMYDEQVQRFLKVSPKKYRKYDELTKESFDYDVCMVGSDQVFNPNLHINSFNTRLLAFLHPGMITASYAASLGGNSVKKEYEKPLFDALSRFDYISIREKSSAEYVSRYLNKPVYQHCDPTMLLSRQEWRDFSKDMETEPYVLLYILHDSKEIEALVKECINNGCKVISVGKRCRIDGVINKNDIPPDQFVGYIANADRVISNSFHGTVFSILFHKSKVDIFLPPVGGDRITSIIELFELESYYQRNVATSEAMYQKADRIIIEEKNKAMEYLSMLSNMKV